MRGSNRDLPVAMEMPEGTVRIAEWGGMNVELGSCRAAIDPAALFAGLPDDRCQCPHWGYLIKGSARVSYLDGPDEIIEAGAAYHLRPGHFFQTLEPVELIELSPVHQHDETMAVVARNMAAAAR